MHYRSIVVKVGTSTLTGGTPALSPARMIELVRQMAQLHQQGRQVVLVSSGAMAAGRERLSFPTASKGYAGQANAFGSGPASADGAV